MHSCADEFRVSITSTGLICKNYDKTREEYGPAVMGRYSYKKGGLAPP